VPGDVYPCDIQIPDFQSFISTTTTYGVTFPTSIFDNLPTYYASHAVPTGTVNLGSSAPGATYTTPAQASLLGLTMANATTAAWPAMSTGITSADMDNDSKVGITGITKTGGSYGNPPILAGGLGNATKLYMALRSVIALNGKLENPSHAASCSEASGAATVTFTDSHIVGCFQQPFPTGTPADCTAAQTANLDGNRPLLAPGSATFDAIKLSSSTTGQTCTTVRGTAFH
jgi:hypothetical protein